MELIAQVEPRGEKHPTGHMVIGQERGAEETLHLGYRFDPDDLPDDLRSPARWPEYLFANTVPGTIIDESDYLHLLTATLGRIYYTKRVECTVSLETVIPAQTKWRAFATYSFNPDDFHSAPSPCYNCVTWATEVGNRVSAGFLTPVRQGRIKLMVEQLLHAMPTGDAVGG